MPAFSTFSVAIPAGGAATQIVENDSKRKSLMIHASGGNQVAVSSDPRIAALANGINPVVNELHFTAVEDGGLCTGKWFAWAVGATSVVIAEGYD